MTPACAELVHSQTCCIYLRASIDTLVNNLENDSEGRPMLNTTSLPEAERPTTSLQGAERRGNLQTRIATLMSRRSATYENTAHVIIDTDGKSIEAIASEIVSLLG